MALPTTPSQTIGPFFRIMLPLGSSELVPAGTAGAVQIEGTVTDGNGEPVNDALIEIWQADAEGVYAHPDDPRSNGRSATFGFGRCLTDAQGRYTFRTVGPGPVPGFDERMQAPHIAVSVLARGLLRRLATRIYFPDQEHANASDPVLQSVPASRRSTLIGKPAGPGRLRFDIHLRGEGETVFFDV